MCDGERLARTRPFGRVLRMAAIASAFGALPPAPLLAAPPGEPPRDVAHAVKASTVPDELAEGLSLRVAMVAMFGAYDSVLGGVLWTAAGLTGDPAWRNGSPLFVRPHAVRRFTEGRRERVLLVTHTLDLDGGRIVPPGASCHACSVLVGMALFERKSGDGWRPIAISQGATRAGSWGAMPQAEIVGNFAAPALRIDDGYMAQGQMSEWTTIVRYSKGQFRPRIVSTRRSCVGGPPCVTTSDKPVGTPASPGRRP